MDKLDFRIGKLSLAPGDALVVKVDHPLSEKMAAAIRSHLDPHLPEGVKALILGREIDLAVLTKADIDARTEARAGG